MRNFIPSFKSRVFPMPGQLCFECNICGHKNVWRADQLQREGGACMVCGSVVRFRSIVAILSTLLYNEIVSLPRFKKDKKVTGLGMSDAFCYASLLSEKFSYTNTYYHEEPLFDITNIKECDHSRYDFVISSDVFEHVLSPVQRAFDNLYKILKPDGKIIFSVPYKMTGETDEHFPVLNEFSVQKESSGEWGSCSTKTRTTKSSDTRIWCFTAGRAPRWKCACSLWKRW